ncbi:hypothetical protein AWM70_19160 [Paenibacillus yonginensis]|uniref:Putative Se/S carrier protein-like domain-containing protein n=1 Tax=Paenibacillus yonginensis TaxID=1462996 RepID=A0A1B1N4S2_9BACL|nr:DUF3343 domain-containing protein [Paenibacillus yonginensis]ANS76430.1 hypothetical protein AWM70_19160 [Paenibacillus yonginensis]
MEDWLVMAFDSTQQALRSETLMEYLEFEFDLFPTPKSITAGCALSIQFPPELLERVVHMIREEKVEIRGIYKLEDEVYQEIQLEEV